MFQDLKLARYKTKIKEMGQYLTDDDDDFMLYN